jgi:RNA polymerase subunit RPABC4/transcription elongation factor Spt4
MSKFSKVLGLVLAVSMTVSFCLADTPAGSNPSASSGQAKSKAASKKVNKAKAKAEKQITAKDSYICPMCHVTADKPGKCPMCGMDMVKNEKKGSDEKKM